MSWYNRLNRVSPDYRIVIVADSMILNVKPSSPDAVIIDIHFVMSDTSFSETNCNDNLSQSTVFSVFTIDILVKVFTMSGSTLTKKSFK